MMAQAGQYPAFNDLYRRFHFSFIFGFIRPGRHNGRLIVTGHLLIGGIQIRRIAMGAYYAPT
jgi:hypothetical protein